jgi:hypothetical protein
MRPLGVSKLRPSNAEMRESASVDRATANASTTAIAAVMPSAVAASGRSPPRSRNAESSQSLMALCGSVGKYDVTGSTADRHQVSSTTCHQ